MADANPQHPPHAEGRPARPRFIVRKSTSNPLVRERLARAAMELAERRETEALQLQELEGVERNAGEEP